MVAAGDLADLTPGNTIIRYTDKNQVRNFTTSTDFSAANVASFGDSDTLLEPGELFEIKLLNLDSVLTTSLGTNTDFVIQVLPPVGAVLFIARTTPSAMETTEVLK